MCSAGSSDDQVGQARITTCAPPRLLTHPGRRRGAGALPTGSTPRRDDQMPIAMFRSGHRRKPVQLLGACGCKLRVFGDDPLSCRLRPGCDGRRGLPCRAEAEPARLRTKGPEGWAGMAAIELKGFQNRERQVGSGGHDRDYEIACPLRETVTSGHWAGPARLRKIHICDCAAALW
jgi:hypothetical protein